MIDDTPIRIAIGGAMGRMGREALRAIGEAPDLAVAGLLVHHVSPEVELALSDFGQVYDDPIRLLETETPDVWLDLSTPSSVVRHVDLALAAGVSPVVGATGYTSEDIARWDGLARTSHVGGIVAPNFAIGALLMMRFAVEAAKWMDKVEIIELHHDKKVDKPSGTAKRTVAAIDAPYEIPIHSVRLPGLVAHQEVLFGGTGETLTIRHDSLTRESFMPGILLACREATRLHQVVYGLEHLLW